MQYCILCTADVLYLDFNSGYLMPCWLLVVYEQILTHKASPLLIKKSGLCTESRLCLMLCYPSLKDSSSTSNPPPEPTTCAKLNQQRHRPEQ